MPEEHAVHHHEEHNEHHEEHAQRGKKFSLAKIRISKADIIALVFLVIFLALLTWPTYIPKGNCEVARPDYKCASVKDVMIENCAYWGNYSCNSAKDVSLPQIEWYIQNLCSLQNQYHGSGLDCSDLKAACNQISQKQVC